MRALCIYIILGGHRELWYTLANRSLLLELIVMAFDAGDTFARLQIVQLMYGEKMYTNLLYTDRNAGEPDYFKSEIEGLADDLVAAMNAVQVGQVQNLYTDWLIHRYGQGTVDSGRHFQSGTGDDVLGQPLPAYWTISFRKTPDLDTQTQDAEHPFRAGRIAFSGISEGLIENGQIAPGSVAALQTLALAFLDNNATPNNTRFNLFLQRDPDDLFPGSLASQCFVKGVVATRLGTQNTRKA